MSIGGDDLIEARCKKVENIVRILRRHLGALESELADIRVLNANSKRMKGAASSDVVKEVGKGDGGGSGGGGNNDEGSDSGNGGGGSGIGGPADAPPVPVAA